MNEPATGTSYWLEQVEPVGRVAKLVYEDHFTRAEFNRLASGLVPKQMEDKWFIYFDGLTAYAHRSWTGQHVYTIEFSEASTGLDVSAAWVSRDVSAGWVDLNVDQRAFDCAMIRFLLRALVLGEDVPFPMPRGMSERDPEILQHALVGRQTNNTVPVPAPSLVSRARSRFWLMRRVLA